MKHFTERKCFMVSARQKAQMKARAAAEEISSSELVRRAVEQHISRPTQ